MSAGWRKARKALPEVFRNLMVISQPASNRDGIVVQRCMEDLAEELRGCNVLQQHDLVGCQSTVEVKKKRAHLRMPDCVIGGDMTACLQLVDILPAKKSKDIVTDLEPTLKQWLKRKAEALGIPTNYTLGPEEVAMVGGRIHAGLEEWLQSWDWIYHGMRQGGHLAYLPDIELGRMRKVEEYPWAGDIRPLGDGNGKIPQGWLTQRYSWINAQGVPRKPRWLDEVEAKELRQERIESLKHIEVTEDAILLDVDDETLFEKEKAALQDHPRRRDAVYEGMLERMQITGREGEARYVGKVFEKKRVRIPAKVAKGQLSEEYMERQRQYLKEGHSIEDLSDRIKKVAKKKKSKAVGSKKTIAASLKLAKKAFKKNKAKEQKRRRSSGKRPPTAADLPDGGLLGRTVQVIKDRVVNPAT